MGPIEMSGCLYGAEPISVCFALAATGLPTAFHIVGYLLLASLLTASLLGWWRAHRYATQQRAQFESEHQQLLVATASQARLTEMMRAIIEGTTDAVFVKDRQGKYLLLNEATSHFVGKPINEILGRDDRDLLHLHTPSF